MSNFECYNFFPTPNGLVLVGDLEIQHLLHLPDFETLVSSVQATLRPSQPVKGIKYM
jgi:hypothetical protein